ncbi:oligosaccharide flippase family protein [Acinetobacter kyonggiensis]|uniref:Membrane protein involved in the export of O-antigen and teichoic acid n=1 Tax=Acinetobacter kyonggiensis TaxID=595670 RepID=A0A1H3KCZ6_9GAMM|nr:oligosaccharide flippase family protein [Acinetobacter kyonggiensis]SDY50001.1 Membrane protein involved in the export of O-antigen and teichoic acid [Acinetobacter kyonggiensis]
MGIFSGKIVSNSLWMMLEKVISIFGLIFVTSYVAKYIGPTNFGKIALATTLFTFVQTLTWFGNQEILFKRVSKNHQSGLNYLSNTQKIRFYLFLFMSLPILFGLYIFTDLLTLIFGIATAFATYFITQDIYAVYNNAVLHSYINAIVNMVGLSIALVVRYVIVLFELEYAYLAIPIVLVTLIPYLLKRYWFNRSLKTPILNQQKYRKYYFLAGGSLVISTLAVSFYTQITSLMLAKLTSLKDLGVYAVAVTLGTAWSFINFAVITSVLSKIYREKSHYESYVMIAKLNLVILAVSLSVVAVLGLLGPWIIETLYGAAYQDAYQLLIILALSTMLSGLGTIAARLMVKEESYAYISKKMLFVALSALPISYAMIYVYGLIGAAYSVFIIELLSLTVFNYFYKDGLIFKIHLFPFFKHSLKMKQ